MPKISLSSKQWIRIISYLIALLIIPTYILVTQTSSHANLPDYAKIVRITGPNTLSVRSGNSQHPADVGTILRRFQDQLLISGDNQTWAQLDFFNSEDQHMGLSVQVEAKNNENTLDYLPCSVLNGDSFVIEWFNGTIGKRGCERGVRIRPGETLSK